MVGSEFPRDELEDRVRRLEMMLAALIASGSSPYEDSDELFYFIIRDLASQSRRPDSFSRLMRDLLKRRSLSRPIGDHLRRIEDASDSARADLAKLEERMTRLEGSSNGTSLQMLAFGEELHAWLALAAMNVPQADVKMRRLLPLRIYVSKSDDASEARIRAALEKFARLFGFSVEDDLPEIRGSWFKKWFVKSQEALSQPEVAERLAKVERALEMKALDSPQAEIDYKKSMAVSELIKSLENTPAAAVQIGTILLVKVPTEEGPVIQIKTLSANELVQIESNQNLLASPAEVLQKLSDLCDDKHKRISEVIILDDSKKP